MLIPKASLNYGNHFILDLTNCNQDKLYFKNLGYNYIREIITSNKATLLNETRHIFPNDAYTVLFLLGESHVSLHSFPEDKYIAIDIYTCGGNVITSNIVTEFILYFESTTPKVNHVIRNNPLDIEPVEYRIGDFFKHHDDEHYEVVNLLLLES